MRLLIFLFSIIPFLSFSQQIFIPDDNFEQILIDLGYDDVLDNFVLADNIIDLTELNLTNLNIVDLTGINSFGNLGSLTAYSNNIFGSLELILPNLTFLSLSSNGITNLDISQCYNLQWLDVQQNLLSSIDLSNNINLNTLNVSYNLINELDLTNNIELYQLTASSTLIEDVDLSMLYNLGWLSFSGSLKSVSLPNNSLDNVNLSNNYLTNVDLSNIPNIGNLNLDNNLLLNLDLSNIVSIQSLSAINNLFNCVAIGNDLDEELFYVDDNVSFSNTCDYNDNIVGCMNNLSPNYNPEANYDDNLCSLIEFQADNYNYNDLVYIADGCFMDVVIPDNIDIIYLGEIIDFGGFGYTILAQNSSGNIYGSMSPDNFFDNNYNTNDYKLLRIWQGDNNEEGLIENQEITFVAIINGVEMLLDLSFDTGSEFFNCNSTAIVSELEVIGPLSGECPQAEISLFASNYFESCSISSYVFYDGTCVGDFDTCGNGYPYAPYNSVPALSYSWSYEGELLTEVFYPNSTFNTANTYSLSVYSNGLYTFINTDALGCVTTQDIYIDEQICSFGCTDSSACNYNSSATVNDSSCLFADQGYDCDGNCLIDTDDDGVCDEFEVFGCIDSTACNYDYSASDDDGSCEYILVGSCDCDDNVLDCSGVCGGTSLLDECGVCDGNNDSCLDCCGVVNGDGASCDGVCGSCNDDVSCLDECGVPNGDNSTCSGCMDETACNYDVVAIIDDGSCINCASVEFEDNSNYLDLDNINFDNSDGVTISLWVHDDDFTQNPEDFSTYIDFGSQDSYRYVIRNRSSKIEAFFEGDGVPDTFNGSNIDWSYPYSAISGGMFESDCGTGTDGWHNITAVYCATGVRLYIDGKITGQSVTYVYFNDFILTQESTKRVGLSQSGEEPSDAIIDEVRIWNRALSAEEVAERSGSEVDINGVAVGVNDQVNLNTSEEIDLVGYWKFDCSYVNEITSLDAAIDNANFSTIQACEYSDCGASEYLYGCPADLEGNTDCNSCDPPEGCMDELACNYDPLAAINIQANCFYIEYYCPFVEYPEYYDCECKCINDVDEDGVCDELDCSPEVYNPEQDCSVVIESSNNKRLIGVTDVLGRDVNVNSKEILLLHIYNDGSVEKNIF